MPFFSMRGEEFRHQCSKLWPSTPYTLKTTVFCLLEYLFLKTCALCELLSIILKWIVCISYFLVDSDGKIVTQQEGTFRSNCMDCLDRTNVIQSLLARRSLQAQLQVNIYSCLTSWKGRAAFCVELKCNFNTSIKACILDLLYYLLEIHWLDSSLRNKAVSESKSWFF